MTMTEARIGCQGNGGKIVYAALLLISSKSSYVKPRTRRLSGTNGGESCAADICVF
jgi:hypothetical protein